MVDIYMNTSHIPGPVKSIGINPRCKCRACAVAGVRVTHTIGQQGRYLATQRAEFPVVEHTKMAEMCCEENEGSKIKYKFHLIWNSWVFYVNRLIIIFSGSITADKK